MSKPLKSLAAKVIPRGMEALFAFIFVIGLLSAFTIGCSASMKQAVYATKAPAMPEAGPTSAPIKEPTPALEMTAPPTPAGEVPTEVPAEAIQPPEPTEAPQLPLVQQELEKIDRLLAQAMPANIAYNTPRAMLLDETRLVQLLLSPSLSGEDLSQRVTPAGPVTHAQINITSRMLAELKPDNPDAIAVQPLHTEAVQLISNLEPTEWKWSITARQEGQHKLYLTLYRLVEYEGRDYWRKVKEYEDTLQVEVTLGQRLARLDWYWALGILITGLLLPGLWFWLGRRKKTGG